MSLVGTVVLSGHVRISLLQHTRSQAPPVQLFPSVYGTGVAVTAPDGRSQTWTRREARGSA